MSGTPAAAGWFDSHCHLHDEPDPAAVWTAARAAGVTRALLVGTDEASSVRALETARSLGAATAASVGLHPHEAASGTDWMVTLLEGASESRGPAGLVAIGECGLDYYYEHAPRAVQRKVFAEQLALARALDLAVVVHTRDAWEDTFDVLAADGVPSRTVIHCFTGGVAEARACLDLGCFVSFSGIVTFKGADHVREAAAYCPLDALLVETDSPFLAPVPHRGHRNEPALVAVVGEAVAAVKRLDPLECAAVTAANAARAFALG